MISRDGPPSFGSIFQFPSDTQNAARQLNLDMEATDRAVASDSDVNPAARSNWDAFFAAWQSYFQPINASSTLNPLGAAAFADQAEIEDWRRRMKVQETALKNAGITTVLPESPEERPENIFSGLGDVFGDLKWIVLGVAGIWLLPKVLAMLPKKK